MRTDLLRRRAGLHTALERSRLLLPAVEVMSDYRERRTAGTILVSELRPDEGEIAGVQASETADVQLRNRLTLRQAELSSDASVATYLWGRVHQASQLPDSHLQWACEVALRASEPQKVIDLMESRLRQDPPLQHGYAQASLFNSNQFST